MADEFTFRVYIISAGRASRGPITAKNFLVYTHIVRKSQESQYIEHGFSNVVGVEDEKINSYDKVFNYIVENAKEDVVAIVDDDIDYFQYRRDETYTIDSAETVQAEFERLAQIVFDLDIGLAFNSPNGSPFKYTREFAFSGMPSACKIVNRRVIKAKMNNNIIRNIDVDYVLQELLVNRICLNPKYIVLKEHPVDKLTRVTGTICSYDDINNSLETMKLRWGVYFGYKRVNLKPIVYINVKR